MNAGIASSAIAATKSRIKLIRAGHGKDCGRSGLVGRGRNDLVGRCRNNLRGCCLADRGTYFRGSRLGSTATYYRSVVSHRAAARRRSAATRHAASVRPPPPHPRPNPARPVALLVAFAHGRRCSLRTTPGRFTCEDTQRDQGRTEERRPRKRVRVHALRGFKSHRYRHCAGITRAP